MIRNIIFDMGQVLIRFNTGVFLNRFASDYTTEERTLLLREVYLSAEWIMQDRGTHTPEQTVEIVCRHLPKKLHEAVYNLVCRWNEDIIPVEGMKELVEELKGNVPAERLYPAMGFTYVDTIKLFYEDTGRVDFELFELVL